MDLIECNILQLTECNMTEPLLNPKDVENAALRAELEQVKAELTRVKARCEERIRLRDRLRNYNVLLSEHKTISMILPGTSCAASELSFPMLLQ